MLGYEGPFWNIQRPKHPVILCVNVQPNIKKVRAYYKKKHTFSDAHLSWVCSAYLLMKKSNLSGMIVLHEWKKERVRKHTLCASWKKAYRLHESIGPSPQHLYSTGKTSQTRPSLCGLHRFGVKVPLCVHGGLLLRLGGVGGVHVVGGDGAGDGADTRHGDLEDLSIKLLRLKNK